jgi:hypothetical protein
MNIRFNYWGVLQMHKGAQWTNVLCVGPAGMTWCSSDCPLLDLSREAYVIKGCKFKLYSGVDIVDHTISKDAAADLILDVKNFPRTNPPGKH